MEVKKNQWEAWLYLIPTIALLLIFTFYPLVKTIFISFLADYKWVREEFSAINFSNFSMVIGNSSILRYFLNTLAIVFISVPVSVILSLFVAVGLNSIKTLGKVYQTIFFLPYVTNTIAIGMVFGVMFSTNGGLVNTVLEGLGFNPHNWMGGVLTVNGEKVYPSYWKSMSIVLIYSVWNAMPFKILILLSGLQGIDKQYYQAAQIDGASKWKTLGRITVPLLSPQIAYLATTSFIGAFKEYTSILAIFGESMGPVGNPRSMGTVVYFIYFLLQNGSLGPAAAAAVLLFIIIMAFTALNMWVSKMRVHY